VKWKIEKEAPEDWQEDSLSVLPERSGKIVLLPFLGSAAVV
jgi:hypothetical protein